MKNSATEGRNNAGCLICGNEVVYALRDVKKECSYCHQADETNTYCNEGHYVCDDCHRVHPNDLIEKYCSNTDTTNPIEMANHLMKNPVVNMHGPEHHYMVAATLIASYCNTDSSYKTSQRNFVQTARKRAESIPGGSCGYLGTCGAGIGAGIFMSIITRATPMSVHGWRYANLATANALKEIAEHGGPRCCKRDTFLSIKNTARFLHESFSQRLFDYSDDIICLFHEENKECLEEECPFYPVEKE